MLRVVEVEDQGSKCEGPEEVRPFAGFARGAPDDLEELERVEPAASTLAVGLDAFGHFVPVVDDLMAISVVHWQLAVSIAIGVVFSFLILLLRSRVAGASSGVIDGIGVSVSPSEDFRLMSSPAHLVVVRMFFAAHDVGARHAR